MNLMQSIIVVVLLLLLIILLHVVTQMIKQELKDLSYRIIRDSLRSSKEATQVVDRVNLR